MDIVAFLLSTTGGIVLLILGIFLWKFMGKGTGANAGHFKMGGKLMALIGALVLIIPVFGVGLNGGDTVDITDDDIVTDYSIVWIVDATTAVISADFSQTDEIASGEYALATDTDGSTTGVTVTNSCAAIGDVCTWDAFAFTNSITADFKSQWSDGARVTSVLGASVDSSILGWGVESNDTIGVKMTFVDIDPRGQSGLIWVDGAGVNKALGATTATSLNEFSPGEAVTSAGLYFAVNEDGLGIVPVGVYSWHGDIVYSDDYGFSHTVVLTISLTTT